MVSASDLQSSVPRFKSCSGHLLDLFSVVASVQILGHTCKYPTSCLLPGGVFNPVTLYLNDLLSGVPVNLLDKLSANSTINKPLKFQLYFCKVHCLATAAFSTWYVPTMAFDVICVWINNFMYDKLTFQNLEETVTCINCDYHFK